MTERVLLEIANSVAGCCLIARASCRAWRPKMVVAFLPGGGYRICLVNYERIKASPADRPRSCQTGRARADDHRLLIHGPSVDPCLLAVNKASLLPLARRQGMARGTA